LLLNNHTIPNTRGVLYMPLQSLNIDLRKR